MTRKRAHVSKDTQAIGACCVSFRTRRCTAGDKTSAISHGYLTATDKTARFSLADVCYRAYIALRTFNEV